MSAIAYKGIAKDAFGHPLRLICVGKLKGAPLFFSGTNV